MKTFREYIKELTVTDRESSNIEDKRDSIEGLIAGFDKPKPPSVIDWAKQVHRKQNPSTVKPQNAIEPEQVNKEVSDKFQKATTPTPHNRMDYTGKIPVPQKRSDDSLGDS
jgi:hypothetical protein